MNTTEARHKRAKLIEEARSIHDRAERERRELTAEEASRFDAFMGDADRLALDIEREERLQGLEGDLSRPLPVMTMGGEELRADVPGADTEHRSQRDPEHNEAFRSWLRRGYHGIGQYERQVLEKRSEGMAPEFQALGAYGDPEAGGYLVPTTLWREITRVMKDFSGVVQAGPMTLRTGNGAPIAFPVADTTEEMGMIIPENDEVPELSTDFASKTLHSHMYSSGIIRASVQLLQDSALNLEAYIAEMMGERIGRILNRHLTVGTGDGQPQGVVTGTTEGVETAAPDAITFDDVVELVHSLDPAYRNRAVFMMNDATFHHLRLLKDGQDRPLWQTSLSERNPDRLLGYGVRINNDMPTIEAGKKVVLFGDFRSYAFRDVNGALMTRFSEKYMDRLQYGYMISSRYGGMLLQPAGMRYLAMADE